ncbi:tetratricopeptide repeat protein [Pseudomonas sp.]|uniref:tetratricopeptide repeat protein n=2 Tax=unclassified Pseudomonas TaxID=196821 RepID=UPI0028A8B3D4|nr:tetratricopeptide repeat protein [Pseudomonas sp.]
MWFMKKKLTEQQAAEVNELGWTALREQDLDTALRHFKTLGKALPDDARWINGIGAVCLARDEEDEARLHFQMAADRDLPAGHYNLALMAYRADDHPTAVEHLQRAIRHDFPLALGLLGEIHLQAERYEEAEQAYRHAARLGHIDSYNNLGLMFLEREDYAQAKQALLQGLQSEHVYAEHNLAVACHRLGELEAAERWYHISFANYGNLQSLENLGYVYCQSGRQAEGEALVEASDKLYEDTPLNDYEQSLVDRLLA